MIDKMSPNQRLVLAIVLSIIFFVGYSAIFPPSAKKQQVSEISKTKETEAQVEQDKIQKQKDVLEDSSKFEASKSTQEKIPSNDIVVIKAKNSIIKIDTLGRISSKELLQEKFRDSNNKHAQVIPSDGIKPLFIRFADSELNQEAISTPYTASTDKLEIKNEAKKVILTQKLSKVTVTKKITFYPDGHYDVEIDLSKDKKYYVYLGDRPKVSKKKMAVAGVMVYTADDVAEITEDGKAEGRKIYSGIKLISAFDQYMTVIMYNLNKKIDVVVERGANDNPVVYFEGMQHLKFNGYVGPKDFKVLKNINPVLTNAIEYGWFTFAAKPLFALLSWLYDMFGNWGWAIVALTVIVRAVLYPLTYKGMMSMQKMKELAPQMKEIKEKYKKDPQRMNAATMELYKKHGANPLGGCLPMLLQIPVFFAIYRVLLNAVELQGAPWMLWINDLSRMDPYYILPLLMGASMFFQQRLTPQNFTDPMQEKVMKYLPVIFTVFFLSFPSGLVLYWFVNNIFSMAQQYIVNQQFENAKQLKQHIQKTKKSEK